MVHPTPGLKQLIQRSMSMILLAKMSDGRPSLPYFKCETAGFSFRNLPFRFLNQKIGKFQLKAEDLGLARLRCNRSITSRNRLNLSSIAIFSPAA